MTDGTMELEDQPPDPEMDMQALLKRLQEENAKQREEIARQREEMAKKDEQLAKQDSYSIRQLLEDGLKGLDIIRRQPTSSTHTATHSPVDVFNEGKFHIFDKIDENNLSTPSLFLLNLQKQEYNKIIYYSNEAEIQVHIRNIVVDVMTLFGIDEKLTLHYQSTLLYMENGESKSNIWVVKKTCGVPVAVIKVTQPGESKLSNLNVLGQVFDYMANMRNSFGQCELFGIVTTLEKWRVVWFPDSDEFAASTHIHPPDFEKLVDQFPVESTLTRTMRCSEEYCLSNTTLLHLIGTALLKSMNAHYRVVPLLSSQRAYIVLWQDRWMWGNISEAQLKLHTKIYLSLPEEKPTHLIVLRHFHGGADGQVCLALTENFNLVVIKRFYDADVCDREFNTWKNIYRINVIQTTLVKSQCLIMPFVFHCIRRGDDILFDFDLSRWARDLDCSSVENDSRIDEWTAKLMDYETAYPEKLSVRDALTQAVHNLAAESMIHGDIEWRHVALLPVIEGSGDAATIVDMKPLLIDVASVIQVENPANALQQMEDRMNELLDRLPN